MTLTDTDRKRAKRWVAHYKRLAWMSLHSREIRRTIWALFALFVSGGLLWFWAPFAGVLVMFVATLPLILMMLAAGVAIVFHEIAVVRERAKGKR
jgi:hypothetical protein